MKYKWVLPEKVSPNVHIVEATGKRHILARILQQRGHIDPDLIRPFLFPEEYTSSPPEEMPNLIKGVERIELAIKKQERILVWGDFDVDGQTSTSLLYAALTQLGAVVDYHIPVRERESHGIRPEFLKPYLEDGIQVVLSCDTGIAANTAIELANSYEVDVIVTDHHDCPDVLPPAYALINPKLYTDNHPLESLPGVGVAYKLIESLYQRAGREIEATNFLDLVALGIVADLAIVTEDTRYLLQLGMEKLRTTQRVGLLELMENAKVIPEHMIDEHIGFQIGPRLNAVGRLADANVSVPLLTTEDLSVAKGIADELERLNEERRFQTELVFESAMEQVKNDTSLLQYAVLVLAHPTWHQGVIGIVASRLVEAFGRPAILLATPEGKLARGSARSVEGVHITQAIASQEELLNGFGGHPMAAGLAMDAAYVERFRRGVSRAVVEQRTGEEVEPVIEIDAIVSLNQLDEALVEELELLAPFGPGNPPVNLLCKKLKIVGHVIIGKDKAHRKLVVEEEGGGTQREILWWNSAEEVVPEGYIDAVLRVRPGFFRGERQLNVTLQDMRLSGVRVEQEEAPKSLLITDYRHEEHARELLDEVIAANPGIVVWGEGGNVPASAVSRQQVHPSSTLAIWTLPPSQEVLASIMSAVKPTHVFVFGIDPELDDIADFTKRLIGLVKYTMDKYAGVTDLLRLSAAMAHTASTVKTGLDTLPAVGLHASIGPDNRVTITRHQSIAIDKSRLEYALSETHAYRMMLKKSRDLSRFVIPHESEKTIS